MEEEEDICAICFENTYLKKFCCNIICEPCWFNNLHMFCPICKRKKLNKKRKCVDCKSYFHVKDVFKCNRCIKWTCWRCFEGEKHNPDCYYDYCFDCDKILYVNKEVHCEKCTNLFCKRCYKYNAHSNKNCYNIFSCLTCDSNITYENISFYHNYCICNNCNQEIINGTKEYIDSSDEDYDTE